MNESIPNISSPAPCSACLAKQGKHFSGFKKQNPQRTHWCHCFFQNNLVVNMSEGIGNPVVENSLRILLFLDRCVGTSKPDSNLKQTQGRTSSPPGNSARVKRVNFFCAFKMYVSSTTIKVNKSPSLGRAGPIMKQNVVSCFRQQTVEWT